MRDLLDLCYNLTVKKQNEVLQVWVQCQEGVMCKSASDEVQLGEADGSYESVDVNNDDLYLVTSPALVRPSQIILSSRGDKYN